MKNWLWAFQIAGILGMLSGCSGPPISPSPSAPTQVSTSHDQATIQALHRLLHERERTIAMQNSQIEMLASQLDALKRIDQDVRERRPVRKSMTVVP